MENALFNAAASSSSSFAGCWCLLLLQNGQEFVSLPLLLLLLPLSVCAPNPASVACAAKNSLLLLLLPLSVCLCVCATNRTHEIVKEMSIRSSSRHYSCYGRTKTSSTSGNKAAMILITLEQKTEFLLLPACVCMCYKWRTYDIVKEISIRTSSSRHYYYDGRKKKKKKNFFSKMWKQRSNDPYYGRTKTTSSPTKQ